MKRHGEKEGHFLFQAQQCTFSLVLAGASDHLMSLLIRSVLPAWRELDRASNVFPGHTLTASPPSSFYCPALPVCVSFPLSLSLWLCPLLVSASLDTSGEGILPWIDSSWDFSPGGPVQPPLLPSPISPPVP